MKGERADLSAPRAGQGPSEETGQLALAIGLVALAGCVDAIGFLRLNHLFVSFMSGNSTQFAIAIARGEWGDAARAGAIVALFVVGVAAGRLIARVTGEFRRAAILGLEALLLALAAGPGGGVVNIAAMVLAMGMQNAALHKAGETKASLTYVTGTLVNLGERLADALSGPRFDWIPYAMMWCGMLLGAGIGALAYAVAGLRAILCPAAAAGLLAVLLSIWAWSGKRAKP